MTGMSGHLARTHYGEGVRDCLRLLQEAAVSDEAVAHEVQAPLAVQPNHIATEQKGDQE